MNSHLFKILSVLITLSLLLSACGRGAGAKTARSERKRELNPAPAQEAVSRLVEGNNQFAWDMYQSLKGRPGNLVYSPFSISLALAMTYAGARGDTESQMQNVLKFEADQPATHAAFNSLDLALESTPDSGKDEAQPLQLRIANAVWAEQTQAFLPDFLDTLAVNYGAGVQLSDFINNFEGVRKEVNDWVEDQTEDKIKDLIPPGGFTSDTRMALVNAIYFKADWLDQFSSDATQDAPFHRLDGTEVSVPTMSQHMMTPYAAGDGWQMVALPYAGDTASMLILVPDQGRFEEIETGLDAGTVNDMQQDLLAADMLLSLPKFKFESSFSLADQLSAMGMPDAFDRGRADFSGMSGKQDLFISDVIHKAFIAVDEEGTEAAAATAVIMVGTAAMITPLTVNIDRPFIFMIRDNASGQILFLGRVVDPS